MNRIIAYIVVAVTLLQMAYTESGCDCDCPSDSNNPKIEFGGDDHVGNVLGTKGRTSVAFDPNRRTVDFFTGGPFTIAGNEVPASMTDEIVLPGGHDCSPEKCDCSPKTCD